MVVRKVVNPITGRPIKVGGPTWNALTPSQKLKAESYTTSTSTHNKYPKGRGRPTKGWASAAPKNPSDRYAVKFRCGNECFLDPQGMKYPVCSKHTKDCKIDCRGVRAAYNRARQYKNTRIAALAKKILKEHGCE